MNALSVLGLILLGIAVAIIPIAAYITHIVYSISHAIWFILVVGILVPPVGIIHGIMIWFGHGLPSGY